MSRLPKKIQPLRKAIIISIIVLIALTMRFCISNTSTKNVGNLKKYPVIPKVNLTTLTTKRSNNEKANSRPVKLDYVVVHLDFKGMPPKLSYLKSLLGTLKRHGVNGLLLEYEDTFPYEGILANLSASHYYKKNELKEILQEAISSGFEIIPLIQTFGNMEYVLKYEEFLSLRERFTRSDSICPSQKESLDLIKEILTQVLGFHQSIAPLKHVHIGCNKISSLNECLYCTKRNLSRADLYMNHVVKVADMVKSLAPDATSLIWWNKFQLMSNHIERFNNIEVVYRSYTPEVNLPLQRLYNVHRKFGNTWIASAFKGVDERNSYLPNIVHRALNTLSWMKNVVDYNSNKPNATFKGIILTGLSRRFHFGALSDLLVPSIPCLLIDITIVNQFRNKIMDKNIDYSKIMSDVADYIKIVLPCDRNIDFTNDLTFCKFEGYELYDVLYKSDKRMQKRTNDINGLLSYVRAEQYGKKSYTGSIKLQEIQAFCKVVGKELTNFIKILSSSMAPYYESILIDEYINNKLEEASQVFSVCMTPNL